MFRSRRLLPVQLRDQSAARREAVTGHTQLTGVGRRQWTHIAERPGTVHCNILNTAYNAFGRVVYV